MACWRETTLGQVCDEVGGIIQTGPFGSQLHESDYSDEGVPVVMPKDIIEGRIATHSVARVSPKHVERLSRHKLEAGDIVYGRRGDIGRQALIRPEQQGWLCGTGCLRLSFGDSVLDPLFLHYYLRQESVVRWISNQAVGATLPNLNTGILRSVPVSIPALPAQRRIAGILSTYDELMENSQRRIRILEAMARVLYREWFVHFRFPGHEKLLRVASPLGDIPQGWEYRELSQLGFIGRGKSRHRPRNEPSLYGGPHPFFQTGDIKEARIFLRTHSQTYSKAGLAQSKLWQPGTLCITIAANIAETAILAKTACFPDSVVGFVPDLAKSDAFYVKMYLDSIKQQMQNVSRGTTQDNLSLEKLLGFRVLTPPPSIIRAFREKASPMLDLLNVLLQKEENLRRTRDLLLPRLLSGQVNLKEN